MRARQTAEVAWAWLNGKALLTGLVASLGILLLLSLIIPQTPVLPSNEAAFLRWQAEIRPTLGAWEPWLSALGLFAIRTSPWLRLTLALLGLSTIARLTTLLEKHSQRSLRQFLIVIGGFCVLIGWGLQLSLGWTETQLPGRPGKTLTIPEHGFTLPYPTSSLSVLNSPYGLYLFQEGKGVQLTVTAHGAQNKPLQLLTSAQSAPQTELQLTLTPRNPEAYFAIASEGLTFRVTLLQPPPATRFRVQIYRSAGGQMLVETVLQGSGDLVARETQLHIDPTSLELFRAVFNPGAPLQGMGLILLVIGILPFRQRSPRPSGAVNKEG